MTLILFDCDGVLVDSEAIACRTLAAEIGAQIPSLDKAAFAAKIFGVTDHDAVRQAEAEYGVRLPDGFADQIAAAIRREVLRSVEPVAGAAEAVGSIDLPMAVVSNSPLERVQMMLDRTGLRRFFDDRLFCAEMVARPKPFPDVYLSAARALGADPARCIAVEDSIAGVTAAVAAGMRVVGFLGGSHIQPGHGDRLLDAGAGTLCTAMSDLNTALSAVPTGD
jgi:HAD superfamily hydrolase (TIGR01509 family)